MDRGLMGSYWYDRALTLRGYADFLREALQLLRASHPAFKTLYSVGDGPKKQVAIPADMGNLDELVLRYSWYKKRNLYGDRNPDGRPNWATLSNIGYIMMFSTGKSAKEGGIIITVSAGIPGRFTPNSLTISFPLMNDGDSSNWEFYTYGFLSDLFAKVIRLTLPYRGVVASQSFSHSISGEGPYHIGWLTYFADERCAPLAGQFPTEKIEVPGTLFTLGRDSLFDTSDETVALGRRLREQLKDKRVLQ